MSIDLDNPGMPTDVSIITTYRCQMRCKMCNIWENPTDRKQEITPKDLEILPSFKFVNVTGGEPFVRNDLEDIVEVMFKKSDRIVISTSGWHTKKIIKMAERFPNIGIRVSIEGLSQKNDDLRGREGGFDRGLKTLLSLKEMGVKDIGFGQTVSNRNSGDLVPLYQLSKELGMEFATAAFHNSYYFHRDDNHIHEKEAVINDFHDLIERLLKENNPKAWFRAFFNLGLPHLRDLQRELHVLADRHMRVQGVGLEHHRDAALGRRNIVDDRAVDLQFAARDFLEPGDHAQQR